MLYSGGGTGASTTRRTTFDHGTAGVYYDYDAREGVRPSRGPSSAPPYAPAYPPYAPAYRHAAVSPDTRRQVTSELDDENLAKALSMSLIEADAQNLARQKLAQISFVEDEEYEKNLAIAQVLSLQDSRPTTDAVAYPRYIVPGFRKKSSERPGPSSLLPADVAPSEVPLTPDDIDDAIMSDPLDAEISKKFEQDTALAIQKSQTTAKPVDKQEQLVRQRLEGERLERYNSGSSNYREAGIRRSRKMRKSKRRITRRKRITKRKRKTRRRH